jgi:hypothetical protein
VNRNRGGGLSRKAGAVIVCLWGAGCGGKSNSSPQHEAGAVAPPANGTNAFDGGAAPSDASTQDVSLTEMPPFDSSPIDASLDIQESLDGSVDGATSDVTDADADAQGGCGGCGLCVGGHCRQGCDPRAAYSCLFGAKCCPLDDAGATGYCVFQEGEICGGCADPNGCCSPPMTQCPPDPNSFDPICVDLTTNIIHCGTCTTKCAAPRESCIAGVCTCLGTICNGTCTSMQYDNLNCGACGNACAATGQYCDQGQCKCPTDRPTVCNGACTDVESDPANCNTCGVACSGVTPQCLDGACAPGPDVLVAGQSSPLNLVIDSTSIYWTNSVPTGAIMKVALSGGPPEALSTNRADPGQLVNDGQSLYWAEASGVAADQTNHVGIWSVPVTGGASRLLVNIPTFALAVLGSTLYFTASVGTYGQNEHVYSMPTSGGVDGGADWNGATELTSGGYAFDALAVDGTYVYFANDITIQRAPIGSSAVPSTKLVGDVNQGPVSLAIDGANLYWVSLDASIGTVPLSGGTPTVLAGAIPGAASGSSSFLVVSSGYVYWTDARRSGAVRKVSVDGGRVTTIANHQDMPAGIAVDSQYVYWANSSDSGAVMRAPR